MRQRGRIVILVAVVIGFVLVAVAYLGAGFVLYDQISRIAYACSNRFATVTPANLDYHLAFFGAQLR